MPYRIYLLRTRLEWIEMAFQACPDDSLLRLLGRVSCPFDQPLYSHHICGAISILNEISCDVYGLVLPPSKVCLVSHSMNANAPNNGICRLREALYDIRQV